MPADELLDVTLRVNGVPRRVSVPARRLLADCLRHDLELTGTHVGCEHGVCGACTILVDDVPVRACLMLAVQADGARVRTVEGLAAGESDDDLHPLQKAFWEHHALQCGFCTPGFLVTAMDLINTNPAATEHEIRLALSGNLCACTGYVYIVRAVQSLTEGTHSD